ncbi:MAG: glycosyltransferase family 2 protein [Conexivisphaera sp.]
MEGDCAASGMISAVVLTKNSSRTIRRCLEGLASADPRPSELMVVDGGSTDGTLDVVREYSGAFRIRVLHDRGLGYGYARDMGWRAASGDYVAMIDSDVVVARDFLGRAAELLERDPGLGAVGGKLRPELDSGERGLIAKFQVRNLAITLHQRDPPYPATVPGVHTACTVFRRRALEEVGGFSYKFVLAKEDSDVSYRLIKRGYRLSLLDSSCRHLETGRRFVRTNFKYGRSYAVISREHPDMAPLWTPKNVAMMATALFPALQPLVLGWYFRRYVRDADLPPLEALGMSSVEVLRQFLRYSGMVHQLIRGGYT